MLPGKISGWLISDNIPFHEVRLLVGDCLVARGEINQARQDVCENHDYNGNPGFSVTLPSELPTLDWTKPTRLVAISVDGKHQDDVQLIANPYCTSKQLQVLLKSNILGLEGHFDGIVQDNLQGWAARRDQKQPAQIWLQSEGQNPIPVICDQYREGMEWIGIPNQSGFSVNINHLPKNWKGLAISCSFDQEGAFKLPQNEEVHLPLEPHVEILESSFSQHVKGYSSAILNAPEPLRVEWEDLDMFSRILDEVENSLNKAATTPAKPESRKPRKWLSYLFALFENNRRLS